MLVINCDGGSRGNPGPAAFGFVVKEKGKIIEKGGGYIGTATNNVAEYTAVIEALKLLSEKKYRHQLSFYLDSQLVVSQLTGVYKVKDAKIRELVIRVHQFETDFESVMYYHIPREKNKEADLLVNLALDQAIHDFK